MKKQLYYDELNSNGNDAGVNPLSKFLKSFDQEIAVYDLKDDSRTSDGTDFYDQVIWLEENLTLSAFHVDISGGEYLTGYCGYLLVNEQEIPVVIYGIGSPLVSASSAVIIQARDRSEFESQFPFINPRI